MDGGDGLNGGCLGAQAAVAERHRPVACGQRRRDLVGREIALGANEDCDIGAGIVSAGEQLSLVARQGWVAISDEALRVIVAGNKVGHRRQGGDDG